MVAVTGLTAARMQEIIDATITDAAVVGDDLILTLHDSSTVNAGNVRGAMGPGGTLFDVVTSGTRPSLSGADEGYVIFETDTELVRIWDGSRWKMQEKVICSSTTRPIMVSGDEGVKIYETDTDLEYTWTGSSWFLTSANMPLFANAAARDAAISGGDRKVGMTVYQTAEGGLFTWNGTAWKGQPNGELGSVKLTASSGFFPFLAGFGVPASTTYRIAGLSIGVNVPSNRILEVEFRSRVSATDNTYNTSLGIYRGTTAIFQENLFGTAQSSCYARSTGTGGAQTFYMYGWVGAIKNSNVQATSDGPAYFIVKDIGST